MHLNLSRSLENENNLGHLSTLRYLPDLADVGSAARYTATGKFNNQDPRILEQLSRMIPAVA